MDKKSAVIGLLIGGLLGIIMVIFIVVALITAIGGSFQSVNMDVTFVFNQTQLEDFIKESPNYKAAKAIEATTNNKSDIEDDEGWFWTYYNTSELNKEYDRGFFDGLTVSKKDNHLIFSGSSFEYGKYVIVAKDIQPYKVELQVLQNGDYVFNGTCYENKMCYIKDIVLQIDDIHIGKESAYFVVWNWEE